MIDDRKPAILVLYDLLRLFANKSQAGDYWKNIALDLTHQNEVLCAWNLKLAQENERLKRDRT